MALHDGCAYGQRLLRGGRRLLVHRGNLGHARLQRVPQLPQGRPRRRGRPTRPQRLDCEYYFSKNHPEIKLQKYDSYTDAYNALLDGRGDAFSTDNTEVLAWAKANPGFTVGIDSLGDVDTIAVAVQKGNKDLLDWINNEIKELGKENFFHEAYKATLEPIYGDTANPDSIVIEGGQL